MWCFLAGQEQKLQKHESYRGNKYTGIKEPSAFSLGICYEYIDLKKTVASRIISILPRL